MSGRQTTLPTGTPDATTHRSIVKDAYSTRDTKGPGESRLEIAAWVVMDAETNLDIKDDDGQLRYARILDVALDRVGAEELSRRTGLKSYADENGGRAASTIRGYVRNAGRLKPADEGGLPSSHPVKRVLRRYARSRDVGHFEDGKATEDEPDERPEPIDMAALKSAYRLARSIASQNGFVFVDRNGEGEAVEDNERIDDDEVRRHDRPKGDTKAAALMEKAGGGIYEYRIDLDSKELEPVDEGLPPGGW